MTPDTTPATMPSAFLPDSDAAAALQQTATNILDRVGGTLDANTMPLLTADQITLLAYSTLRAEVLEGGFIQLIHNGYGPFIFLNPFAKAMRLWGKELAPDAAGEVLHSFSRLVYDGRQLFERHGAALTAEMDDDAFMALYEQYPDFDELDDTFIDTEDDITAAVMSYVSSHQDAFS